MPPCQQQRQRAGRRGVDGAAGLLERRRAARRGDAALARAERQLGARWGARADGGGQLSGARAGGGPRGDGWPPILRREV